MVSATKAEQIGIVMVHGIGEQGRFEHLDAHIRGIIKALRRTGATVSVEIKGGSTAAFQAMQDSWATGPHPALRLLVRGNGPDVDINVHEVWWADVNEGYSVAKQFRFWLWGLAIWARPGLSHTGLPTHDTMFPPRQTVSRDWWKSAGVRVRLWLVGCLFLMISLTIGLILNLAKRLLNLNPPDLAKIFTNYLSSIKLYSQGHRDGGDFLDAVDNPPRTSIRRRMIRTLADVAAQGYGRWYILAHSQGSVVAFNGVMEPAFGWPGYLDEERWRTLCDKGMAGPAREGADLPTGGTSVPPRPGWAGPRDIVYRRKIFAGFRGLLTYGNPLEKFAALWPPLVPVCREPAFNDAQWINVFDPLDSVSGVMKSWPTRDDECCPAARNVGFATSRFLLLGHIKYLDCPDKPGGPATLADGVAAWLRTTDDGGLMASSGKHFFPPTGARAWTRTVAAWLEWALAFAAAAALGAWLLPIVLRWLGFGLKAAAGYIGFATNPATDPSLGLVERWLAAAAATVENGTGEALNILACVLHRVGLPTEWVPFGARALLFLLTAAAATSVVGAVQFRWTRKSTSPALPDEPFKAKPSPDP